MLDLHENLEDLIFIALRLNFRELVTKFLCFKMVCAKVQLVDSDLE